MKEPGEVEARERDFFDRYYEDLACHPVGLEERLRRELRSLLRVRGKRTLGRVLSIGCGEGSFELMLAAHAGEVVGIDLARPGIERARARAGERGIANVEFRCMPVAELEWAERFDAIVCLAFLHHLPEAELPGFLACVCEHVRPGGFFYSQDPNAGGLTRKLGRLVLRDRYDAYHSPDERELWPREVAAELRRAGFDDVQLGYIDLSLIPLGYLLPRGPGALMHLARWVDGVWCATPLAPWSSGFTAFAARAG